LASTIQTVIINKNDVDSCIRNISSKNLSESDDSSDEEDECLITYVNKKIVIPRTRCKNYIETVACYRFLL